eukprot:TRINITY_DN2126_c0_g1_i4.p1 TRINITY_DN2126_c0_g1~~TRINITY_DN2126_c0_g1_i4.p1  ORF type:complete len:193 (-),score=28.95 TRINITY_DN2126_c0_g1_i4:545-1123(-)
MGNQPTKKPLPPSPPSKIPITLFGLQLSGKTTFYNRLTHGPSIIPDTYAGPSDLEEIVYHLTEQEINEDNYNDIISDFLNSHADELRRYFDTALVLFENFEKYYRGECLFPKKWWYTKTTGFYEKVVVCGDVDVSVMDVGGDRPERRRWLYALNEVVVFFFSIGCDADGMCSYQDSIEFWEEFINARFYWVE